MKHAELVKALWADQLRVKYAAGGLIDVAKYPMPTSIHVEGAGDLTLPLSGEDFLKLKAVSTEAPYGRGEQTLVDTDVRCAWQVEASKVSCSQIPNFFPQVVRDLAAPALMELGVDADALGLEVRLYKLLLYEQGGHFKIHRDTEKEVGMFATMILQLPTEAGHEGGQLKIRHGNKSVTFDFSGAGSMTGYFKTVFFCDCEHSLAEVTSGSRLCMAFNLVRNNAKFMDVKPLRLPHYISALGEVQKQLKQWANGATDKSLPVLAIPLGHCYSKNSLSFAGLKGYDRVVTALVLSCTSFLDVHLCMFEQEILTEGDQDGEKVRESFTIINWESLNHKKSTLKSCEFNINNIVGRFNSKEDPTERPEEADLGNEGGGLLTSYYAAGLVVWPKHHRVGVLCKMQYHPNPIMDWLDEQHEQEPERTGEDFRCLLATYLEGQAGKGSGFTAYGGCGNDSDGYMLDFCLRHDLRDAAFMLMKRKASVLCESATMVSAIQRYGWEDCYREAIQEALSQSTEWSGLCALPKRLQENDLQDAAMTVAKMIIKKDLKKGGCYLKELLEFFVWCGLEEEAWLIVDNPSFFDPDSMAKVVKKWGGKSLPRIEQKLKQQQERRDFVFGGYYGPRGFLKCVAKFVTAVDREGYPEAALAFSKMFLNDALKITNARDEEDFLVILLSCNGMPDKVVAVVQDTIGSIAELASAMKEAANLIGLKKDVKVTDLYAELLSKELKNARRSKAPVLNVLDRVCWLGDEKVIVDLVTLVEENPLMVLEALEIGMKSRKPLHRLSVKPLDAETLLERSKAWDNVGRNGFRKVVKVLLDFIASDSRVADAGSGGESDEEDGKSLQKKAKRLKVSSRDGRIKQDLRLKTAAAKTESLLKMLHDLDQI